MAEEFHTNICGGGGGGGNWWNTARTNSFSSPCTASVNDPLVANFGWSTPEMIDINTRSSDEASSVLSDSSSIHVFPDTHKPIPPAEPSDSTTGGGGLLIDSQLMGFNLSTTAPSDWNPTLLQGSGREEVNFHPILQEEPSTTTVSRLVDFQPEAGGADCPNLIQKDYWSNSNKNYGAGSCEDSSVMNVFRPINLNQCFHLDQNQFVTNPASNSGDSTACHPMSTLPVSAPYGFASATLLQPMTDPQSQESVVGNNSSSASALNYYPANYSSTIDETSVSWPKFAPILKPSLPKMQPANNNFHFSNNATFWNGSSPGGLTDMRATFVPQSQFLTPAFDEKPNLPNLSNKQNSFHAKSAEEAKKSSGDTFFKRPRIETPSPLPTFKVRKEKLGDRITALQQLVSPFGKTDTASVLHEAIDYIKFLHDQVSVLSTPYMKNGAPIHCQQASEKQKEAEGLKQDLRSRGLCLVPISSTFPVANETTQDYWTPTFGGTYR